MKVESWMKELKLGTEETSPGSTSPEIELRQQDASYDSGRPRKRFISSRICSRMWKISSRASPIISLGRRFFGATASRLACALYKWARARFKYATVNAESTGP